MIPQILILFCVGKSGERGGEGTAVGSELAMDAPGVGVTCAVGDKIRSIRKNRNFHFPNVH